MNGLEWTGMDWNELKCTGIIESEWNNTRMDRNEPRRESNGPKRLTCSYTLTVKELNRDHPTSITGRVYSSVDHTNF